MANQGQPWINREHCTCIIDPKGHYHYDRQLWIQWFMLPSPKPGFLASREHIRKAIAA